MILYREWKHPYKRVFLMGRWRKVRRSDKNKRRMERIFTYRGYKKL